MAAAAASVKGMGMHAYDIPRCIQLMDISITTTAYHGGESKIPTHFTNSMKKSILCRLDHLEFSMRRIEERRCSSSGSLTCNTTPMDHKRESFSSCSGGFFSPNKRSLVDAVAEVEKKGSVLERLERAEGILARLCAELDAEKEEDEAKGRRRKGILMQFMRGTSCIKSIPHN